MEIQNTDPRNEHNPVTMEYLNQARPKLSLPVEVTVFVADNLKLKLKERKLGLYLYSLSWQKRVR